MLSIDSIESVFCLFWGKGCPFLEFNIFHPLEWRMPGHMYKYWPGAIFTKLTSGVCVCVCVCVCLLFIMALSEN